MAYNEQKLLHFETSILTEAELKAAEIEQELSDFTSSELEKARQGEYDKNFRYMQDRIKAIKQNYNQLITKTNLDSKRKLLEFRVSLLESIFDQVTRRLADFSQTPDYKEFLVSSIQSSAKEFPCESATIHLREADMKYMDLIKRNLPSTYFECDDKNILGGYKIINAEKGLMLDETFESNLYKQRRGFYEHCELTV